MTSTAPGTTAATVAARTRTRPRSMREDRRRALIWSYFFLGLFVVFFLTPPLYMLITSLKSNAEISRGGVPWWTLKPTLENYAELLSSGTYLVFFRNSAVVSVLVVIITMLISIPAAFALSRMKFWGSGTLATGVFLTYLIPETLLFIPLFKIFAFVNETTGIELILKRSESSGFWSTSTLSTTNLPGLALTSASSSGPRRLQGPHHSA